MNRRREQRWARADARLAIVWLVLLASGVPYPPMIFVAFGLLVLVGAVLLARHLLRERRLNKEGPPPFWADEL